jgi:hypothetical protein
MKFEFVRVISVLVFCWIPLGPICLFQVVAQDKRSLTTQGTTELGGNISYQRTNVVVENTTTRTYNTFSFLPYIGYFPFNNFFEVGLNPVGIQTYWDSQDKVTDITILLALTCNFNPVERIYPFIELQLGYAAEILGGSLGDLNPEQKIRDGFSWGARGGVKIEVAGHCLLNMGAQYQQITLTPKGSSVRNGSDLLMFSAGLTFWF